MTQLRAVLAFGLLVATITLAACGGDRTNPSDPPGHSGDLRARLATALRPGSPATADLVEDRQTTLTPVEADWLSGWQIVDVINSTGPHPRRFYAALSDGGPVEVLTGRQDAFSTVLVGAGAQIGSADVAASVAAVFLDSTRDFQVWAYRIERVEDIQWRPKLTPEETGARDALLATYRDQVKPPQSEGSPEGWVVTVWMVDGLDLVRHTLGIASGIAITDQVEMAAKDIPVPYSR